MKPHRHIMCHKGKVAARSNKTYTSIGKLSTCWLPYPGNSLDHLRIKGHTRDFSFEHWDLNHLEDFSYLLSSCPYVLGHHSIDYHSNHNHIKIPCK